MQTKPIRFELFLDESGRFMESSADARERSEGKQAYPSQFAGILAPAGDFNASSATSMLTAALAEIGTEFRGQLHSTEDLKRQSDLCAVTRHLSKALLDRRWHAVRIVNRERVSYGNRSDNITNILGELCLRILTELDRLGLKNVELTVIPARVRLTEQEGDDGFIRTLEQPEYWKQVQAALTNAAVRAGRGNRAKGWRVSAIKIRSARDVPELMICDVVSYSSFDEFKKLDEGAETDLRAAIGGFDFTLQVREDLEAVKTQLANQATGHAIQHLAERLSSKDLDPTLRSLLEQQVQAAVEQLAQMGAPARNPQLEIINSSLEEVARHTRDLPRAARLTKWLSATLLPRLGERLDERGEADEIAWFAYSLCDRALETANHAGDLSAAQDAVTRMHQFEDQLVSRWEHVDRFAHGQIHAAVHLTDSREFEEAAAMASRVANFHADIGQLFHDALPDRFPDRVRSKRRGEALGTALQALMYMGAASGDAEPFDEARRLNEEAIDEFDQAADRTRQMQYRCQLEAFAGDFDESRHWLAKSMDLPVNTPLHEIAQAIAAESDDTSRGFLLLHLARLGAMIARNGSKEQVAEFESAFEASGMAHDRWLQGGFGRHPQQALLRYRAESSLAAGHEAIARTCLNHLRSTCLASDGSIVLAAQLIACQAHLAAHLVRNGNARARSLLDNKDKKEPGLLQLIERATTAFSEHPRWLAVMDELRTATTALKDDKADVARASQSLDSAARQIAL